MALSEHEARTLDQIEQSLNEESPRLARRFMTWTVTGQSMAIAGSLIAAAMGLALLIAGVNSGPVFGPVLGVGGYLVFVDACRQVVRRLLQP